MNSSGLNKRTLIQESPSSYSSDQSVLDISGNGSQITRRVFCNEILLISTGVLLVAHSVAGETLSQPDSMLAYPPMKIEGAERLLAGSSLYFEYPTRNDPAVLVRTREGEYSAFSRKCSHAGCSVEFDCARRCLKCPCHLGVYDARMGYVVYGPPQRPLDQIVLQMRSGGQVWAVGKSIGRNAADYATALKLKRECFPS
ncbi:MAG TPA: Rieske 2Fe-2S domain-containing protein [Pyrinomonadaceae bacterium]|jgi:Rieske Fe-S protein|nr:Rieske 2Fe-2S domain-containing protein [Pyrinomonadaceae bacterium]